MATDATGTPTSPDNIPTYNTAGDPPSGKGFNAAMAAIQTIITQLKAGTLPSGKIAPAGLAASGTKDATTYLRGDDTWAAPGGASVAVASSIAGLGTASDGKLGKLALGGGEIMLMVYDSGKGKWVSQERTGWSSSSTGGGGGISLAAGQGQFLSAIWDKNFAAKATAGLTPEFRFAGWWASSQNVANALQYVVRWRHVTLNTASWTEYNASAATNFTPASINTAYGLDTGWVSTANPGTPFDNAESILHVLNNTGVSANIQWDIVASMRWFG